MSRKKKNILPEEHLDDYEIDGEYFTVKRCYQFRPSTVRKLNELKANDPDFNIYLNTILDAAILHYYDYIFNSNKNINNA